MATNIEIEAKVLITEKEYNNVLTRFKSQVIKEYDQINHYIDSDDLALKKLGIGCRIREKDNTYTLTLKAPMSEGLLEKDETLNKEQFNAFVKRNVFPECNIEDFIRMLGVDPTSLKVQTALTTHRVEVAYEDNTYEFSIDKNTYNDLVDYELEMAGASLSKAKEKLKSICLSTNTFYKDNLRSKETRALESIVRKQ